MGLGVQLKKKDSTEKKKLSYPRGRLQRYTAVKPIKLVGCFIQGLDLKAK